MNPLQSRLAALRSRLRLVVTLRGVCFTVAALLAGLLMAGLVDSQAYSLLGVETWPLLRAAFLTVILTCVGVVSYLLLVRPLIGRNDDLSLALRVEEHYPILNDALASTVQFLDPPHQSMVDEGGRPGISPSLQKEAVQRALRLAQSCDFNKAVNTRGVGLSVAAIITVAFIVIPLVLLRPAVALTALARTLDPFGEHSWIGRTDLEVRFPAFLAIGQPLSIAGEVRGVVPPKADIEFDDSSMPMRQADIKELSDGHGTFIASGIRLPTAPTWRGMSGEHGGGSELRFRVRAGNAVSPKHAGAWHTVALRRPPLLAPLNGKPSPQIVVHQPRYTELTELMVLPEGTGNLDVVAGSHVLLRAATDLPIYRVWVDFRPLFPGAKDALILAGLGPRHPLDSVATNELANAVWGRVPGIVHQGGKEFTICFTLGLTGAYTLTIQDKDGLSKSYEFDLNVRPDPVPVVSLIRPSASQSVLANAEITLQVLAVDDVFALRTVFLEYRRKDKRGQWLDTEAKRLLFYDHAKAESGFAQVMSVFSHANLTSLSAGLLAPPLHLRPQQLLITQRWPLRGLAVEGETLVIQACAEDFNDVVAFPQTGKSHEIELKIVGKTALAAVLDEQEVLIQQQLLNLRAMQERAINTVIGAEQQWRATGKLRPEDVVELAEAEQVQKDIQARIGGKKDEGLRAELAQLEEMLKDNKLPKSEVGERVRAIREELERISRENLPKIEPLLNKARRELENPEQPQPSSTPTVPPAELKGDLGEARDQQDKVHQALDDLLNLIEEQSTFQQLKGELRTILQDQKEREKEVVKLQEEVDQHGAGVLRQKSQLKVELRRTAELQRRLADRTEKLIEQLKQASDKLTDTNPQVAEMLARAAKIGGSAKDGGEEIAAAMREVANRLRDDFDLPPKTGKNSGGPDIHTARNTQDKVLEDLGKMLEALDQARADEVERLVVHQKKEEKNLGEITAKMAQLQDKIENARKIADPKEREAALRKLGDELRALQKETGDAARELNRAQAKEAANDLNDAVKKMDRVLRTLERGEEPDEELEQARERINAAKSKLKEAREIAEEELAREQIAKIVDRLKGLKERQEAVLAEATRLRQEFLMKGNWTWPKVRSLDDLNRTQEGVAAETALLKDKLKGAKVFHTMLDRAQQDMAAAQKKGKEWHQKANHHWQQKQLDDKELAAETLLHAATVKPQKSASDRLARLIDALLPELEGARQGPNQGQAKEGGAEAEKKGGIMAQDGIPPVAQLKALKAEQLEVNARTKEFAEQHPNVNNLSPAEREEFETIHAEQDRLLQLFRELIAPASSDGGKP